MLKSPKKQYLSAHFYQNEEFRNFQCKFLDQEQCYQVLIPIYQSWLLLFFWLYLSIRQFLVADYWYLKWIRCSPLMLKACQSSCLNNWGLLKGPGFRLISSESRSNKGYDELSFLNLNLDIAKMLSSLWKFDSVMGNKLTSKTTFQPILRFWKSIKNAH